MADNRMYIKCSICGDKVFLAKSFSDGYYQAVYSPEEQHRRLEDFYKKHAFCCGSECDGLYEIVYEEPPVEVQKPTDDRPSRTAWIEERVVHRDKGGKPYTSIYHRCKACGYRNKRSKGWNTKFCPHCGAERI